MRLRDFRSSYINQTENKNPQKSEKTEKDWSNINNRRFNVQWALTCVWW
jgi:hypothetical protein